MKAIQQRTLTTRPTITYVLHSTMYFIYTHLSHRFFHVHRLLANSPSSTDLFSLVVFLSNYFLCSRPVRVWQRGVNKVKIFLFLEGFNHLEFSSWDFWLRNFWVFVSFFLFVKSLVLSVFMIEVSSEIVGWALNMQSIVLIPLLWPLKRWKNWVFEKEVTRKESKVQNLLSIQELIAYNILFIQVYQKWLLVYWS